MSRSEKKVLFVLRRAGIGGTATSMYNLLSLLNERGKSADVLLFSCEGEFTEQFKGVSNLLPEEKILSAISCSSSTLKKRGIISVAIRCAYVLCHRLLGVRRARNLFYRISARKFSGKYSAVVAYQEDLTTDYVAHIKSERRIAWCHMDYDAVAKASKRSVEYSKKLYSKYDYIMCVSEVIKDSMIINLRWPKEKIDVVYNTIPPKYIKSRADEQIDVEIPKKQYRFVSVGRLVDRKRFDRVVLAAEALRKKGVDFVWYILGTGPELESIDHMIKEKELENEVLLLGAKKNPFPYIKMADCFVMSSENEGQPMVLNEALTLGIPTISTEFPSSREVIKDRENGLLVSNNEIGLIDGVALFVDNADLREAIKDGARKFVYDNDSILNRVELVLEIKE